MKSVLTLGAKSDMGKATATKEDLPNLYSRILVFYYGLYKTDSRKGI